MKVSDVYNVIDQAAPFASCEGYDNVGVLIGDFDAEVKKCLIVLDITHDVIQEAKVKGCTMILTHHPVIFHPLKRISFSSVQGELLNAGVTVLSAHTNFDKAAGGLNVALAGLIGLKSFQPLDNEPCVGIGKVDPTNTENLLKNIGMALNLQGARYYDSGKVIKTVMLCCGGGGSMIHRAIDEGVDCLVSGDFKHDQVIDAMNSGISCIDAGHYETEKHFVPLCKEWLGKELSEIQFIASEAMRPAFKFYQFE